METGLNRIIKNHEQPLEEGGISPVGSTCTLRNASAASTQATSDDHTDHKRKSLADSIIAPLVYHGAPIVSTELLVVS
jgi:hypothetical protein